MSKWTQHLCCCCCRCCSSEVAAAAAEEHHELNNRRPGTISQAVVASANQAVAVALNLAAQHQVNSSIGSSASDGGGGNGGPVWSKPSDEWMAKKDDGGIWMGVEVAATSGLKAKAKSSLSLLADIQSATGVEVDPKLEDSTTTKEDGEASKSADQAQ